MAINKLNSYITSNTKLNPNYFQTRDNKIDEIISTLTDSKVIHQMINKTNTLNFDNVLDLIEYGIILSPVDNAIDKQGGPIGAYGWGLLISVKSIIANNSYANLQIYIPDSKSEQHNIYFRTLNNLNKNTWRYISISGTVNSVENS